MGDVFVRRDDLIEELARRDMTDGNVKVFSGREVINVINGARPQLEIIRCKDCKHFHYNMPYVIRGAPVFGHEVCDFWGDGCKTNENGYCSYAERRTDGSD